MWVSACVQVRQQKGHLFRHADPPEGRLEFQAVERHQARSDPDNVGGVEIPVAFPDSPVLPALPHPRGCAIEVVLELEMQRVDLRGGPEYRTRTSALLEISGDARANRLRGSPKAGRLDSRQTGVNRGELNAELSQ